ncbi:MAG: sugar ABC transporter ATP-binding protein, partial [Planctomycetes bacterium]|nr:sugar ABC transporter ATP-binding protein [Planctomycetota bacterium]
MAKLLRMSGVEKSFFGVRVLKGVDLDLDYGEVHVLLGENGAGKSTLMKILSGAYTLDAGEITFDQQTIDLSTYSPRTAEDLGIVTVYQNFHLIPDLTVAENLSLNNFVHERGLIRWREVFAHARAVLDHVNFEIDLRAKVRDLPVSQKQMLEIANALSKNAKLLVMDEPTAALSGKEVEILFDTIKDIKTRGIGIIYISHKLEEVKRIGDRITVLRDGANVATLDADEADLNQVINLMIGKEVRADRDGRISQQVGAELFRVERLSNNSLPTAVNLSVHKGEILGITGLVGSGKTELAQALFGVDPWTTGVAYLDGRPVKYQSPRRAIKLGMGFLPEDRDADGLCLNMGVKENLSLVQLAKLRSFFFSVANERRAANQVVDAIAIKTAGLSQQVKYLSGGNKQKVVLGKWLGANCRLLILDEPTIGIDVGAR